MSKEDSSRTEATPVAPIAQASRDEDKPEVEETVVLAEPENTETRDYEDIIRETEDPRAHIYARHSEKRSTEIENDAENPAIADENAAIAVENDDSAAIIEEADAEMVEVKVYGDTRMVSKSKVDKAGGIAEYQKQLAVQEGMQRNADQAAQLKAREDALDERERQGAVVEAALPTLDTQTGRPTPTDPPTGDQNFEAMARQYQEAVYEGDENAPSILVDMVAKAANSGEKFDKDAFRTQVKEELREDQRKADTVKATRSLIEKTPELNQRDTKFDPRLFTAVDDETSVVRRQHPEWEPAEQVQEAYTRVQKWKGGHKTPTMTDKQDAKRGMNRPKSGTQRYTQPPPAPAKTRSDYVAEQRRLRGQEI